MASGNSVDNGTELRDFVSFSIPGREICRMTVREVISKLSKDRVDNIDEAVQMLIAVWTAVAAVPSNLSNVVDVFHSLFRETSLTILSGRWIRVTSAQKRQMAKVLTKCSQVFGPLVNKASRLCTVLVLAVYDPWGEPALNQLVEGQIEHTDTSVGEFVNSEPEELLLTRVESLTEAGHVEAAIQLCKSCLKYCNSLTKSDEELKGFHSSSDENDNDKNYMFLEKMLFLLHHQGRIFEIINEVEKLKCDEAVHLISETLLKCPPNDMALPETLTHLFLIRDIILPSKYCCTKELMTLWCKLQFMQQTDLQEVCNAAQRLICHASCSAYFYLFVDKLWEQFGFSLLPLYLEIYVRGITLDLNYLENMKRIIDTPNVIQLECHLEFVFDKLSSLFFGEYDELALECLLTAYSFNPKEDKLTFIKQIKEQISKKENVEIKPCTRSVEIIGNDIYTLSECKCGKRCSSPSEEFQNLIDMMDERRPVYNYNFSHLVLDGEIKGVSYSLLKDFVSLLECIRNRQLKSEDCFEDIRKNCMEYLEKSLKSRMMSQQTSCYDSADSEMDSLSEEGEEDTLPTKVQIIEETFSEQDLYKISKKGRNKTRQAQKHNNMDSSTDMLETSKYTTDNDLDKEMKKRKKKRKTKREKDRDSFLIKESSDEAQTVHKTRSTESDKSKYAMQALSHFASLGLSEVAEQKADTFSARLNTEYPVSSKSCDDITLPIRDAASHTRNPVVVLSDILSDRTVLKAGKLNNNNNYSNKYSFENSKDSEIQSSNKPQQIKTNEIQEFCKPLQPVIRNENEIQDLCKPQPVISNENEIQDLSKPQTIKTNENEIQDLSKPQTVKTNENEIQDLSKPQKMKTYENEIKDLSKSQSVKTNENQIKDLSKSQSVRTNENQIKDLNKPPALVTNDNEIQDLSKSQSVITNDNKMANASKPPLVKANEDEIQNLSKLQPVKTMTDTTTFDDLSSPSSFLSNPDKILNSLQKAVGKNPLINNEGDIPSYNKRNITVNFPSSTYTLSQSTNTVIKYKASVTSKDTMSNITLGIKDQQTPIPPQTTAIETKSNPQVNEYSISLVNCKTEPKLENTCSVKLPENKLMEKTNNNTEVKPLVPQKVSSADVATDMMTHPPMNTLPNKLKVQLDHAAGMGPMSAVATLTIPLPVGVQNSSGSKVLSGRLVIPVNTLQRAIGASTSSEATHLITTSTSNKYSKNHQMLAIPNVIVMKGNIQSHDMSTDDERFLNDTNDNRSFRNQKRIWASVRNRHGSIEWRKVADKDNNIIINQKSQLLRSKPEIAVNIPVNFSNSNDTEMSHNSLLTTISSIGTNPVSSPPCLSTKTAGTVTTSSMTHMQNIKSSDQLPPVANTVEISTLKTETSLLSSNNFLDPYESDSLPINLSLPKNPCPEDLSKKKVPSSEHFLTSETKQLQTCIQNSTSAISDNNKINNTDPVITKAQMISAVPLTSTNAPLTTSSNLLISHLLSGVPQATTRKNITYTGSPSSVITSHSSHASVQTSCTQGYKLLNSNEVFKKESISNHSTNNNLGTLPSNFQSCNNLGVMQSSSTNSAEAAMLSELIASNTSKIKKEVIQQTLPDHSYQSHTPSVPFNNSVNIETLIRERLNESDHQPTCSCSSNLDRDSGMCKSPEFISVFPSQDKLLKKKIPTKKTRTSGNSKCKVEDEEKLEKDVQILMGQIFSLSKQKANSRVSNSNNRNVKSFVPNSYIQQDKDLNISNKLTSKKNRKEINNDKTDKKFRCIICPSAFAHHYSLKRHYKSIHRIDVVAKDTDETILKTYAVVKEHLSNTTIMNAEPKVTLQKCVNPATNTLSSQHTGMHTSQNMSFPEVKTEALPAIDVAFPRFSAFHQSSSYFNPSSTVKHHVPIQTISSPAFVSETAHISSYLGTNELPLVGECNNLKQTATSVEEDRQNQLPFENVATSTLASEVIVSDSGNGLNIPSLSCSGLKFACQKDNLSNADMRKETHELLEINEQTVNTDSLPVETKFQISNSDKSDVTSNINLNASSLILKRIDLDTKPVITKPIITNEKPDITVKDCEIKVKQVSYEYDQLQKGYTQINLSNCNINNSSIVRTVSSNNCQNTGQCNNYRAQNTSERNKMCDTDSTVDSEVSTLVAHLLHINRPCEQHAVCANKVKCEYSQSHNCQQISNQAKYTLAKPMRQRTRPRHSPNSAMKRSCPCCRDSEASNSASKRCRNSIGNASKSIRYSQCMRARKSLSAISTRSSKRLRTRSSTSSLT